ncbi:MAG: type II secretion system F family protein, partial [Candidatus Humimicrobiaceae bacterium]
GKNKNLTSFIFRFYKKSNLPVSFREFIIIIFIIFSAELLLCTYFYLPVFITVFIFFTTTLIIYVVMNSLSTLIVQKKENQLGSFLIDMAGNLYGNPNILVSIRKSIEKTNPPLRNDLQVILDDCAKGILLKDALKNMINRNKSNLIEIVLMGIIAANEKGVDLVAFLNYQIEYLREKKSLNNYIKILSTGPRYTSYFIMIIPLVSIIVILLLNKNFINLYLSGFGLIVIIYSLVSYIAGFFLINKIVNNLNKSVASV